MRPPRRGDVAVRLHCHRRDRRRLLSVRRRHREGAERERPRHPGDRGGDLRFGRQSQADSRREGRYCVHARRHARRRGGCARRVWRRPAGAGGEPRRAVLELHAARDPRLGEHHQRGRAEGENRLDGIAGKRHGSDRVSGAASRRSRSRPRHLETGIGRVGIGRRAEGRQDRRVLLERRAADAVASGSVAHVRHHHPDDPERRPGARAAARAWRSLLPD